LSRRDKNYGGTKEFVSYPCNPFNAPLRVEIRQPCSWARKASVVSGKLKQLDFWNVFKVRRIYRPQLSIVNDSASGNGNVDFATPRTLEFAVEFGGSKGFCCSKRNRVGRRKQRFLSLNLFRDTRPTPPLKKHWGAERDPLAGIQQLSKT
jgi:hypothetical protein